MHHKGISFQKLLRILCFLAGIMILLLSLTAAEHIPLHERVLIQGIGIDRDPNGRFHVTVQAVPTGASGDAEVYESDGASVYDALDNITRYSGKSPFYTQTSIVILGKQCTEQGLRDVFDFFIRYPEARPGESIFLAKGSAGEILTLQSDPKTKVKDETIRINRYVLAEQIEQLAGGDPDPQLMSVEILDAANALYSTDRDVYLPVLSVEKGSIKADGCAVFSRGILSGMLDQNTAAVIKAFHSPLKGGTLNLSLPGGGTATLRFITSDCRVTPEIQRDLPRFHVSLSCRMRVEEVHFPDGKTAGRQYPERLRQSASDTLRGDLEKALDAVVKRYHSDVVCFGKTLLRRETAWWKRHEKEWDEIFSRVSYDVSVRVDLAEEGSAISPDSVTKDLP